MSSKQKRARSKSGFLTGLMIVSTGLIAGFHGFELAMSEKNNKLYYTANNSTLDDQRSPKSVKRQVSALDQIITASLEQNPSGAGSIDSQGLADLIKAAQNEPSIDKPSPQPDFEAANHYPVVNRTLKQDRDPVRSAPALDEGKRDALTAFIETANPPVNRENAAPKKAVIETSKPVKQEKKAPSIPALNSDVPFADSADIALFAADMPLPAKLTGLVKRGNNGLPLLARAHRTSYNHSPLVPKKFVSGKAFGGLAERAFQKRERRCMTTALYFEARSEPESGQIAVGQVVMNRVRSPDYPDTICGVVYQGSHRRTGCQFSFTCDGKADKPNNKGQWERSKRLANQVLEGQIWLKSIGHATHYHATYVKPRWRRKMARLKQIGRHIFYKSPNISVTDTYQRYMSGKRS